MPCCIGPRGPSVLWAAAMAAWLLAAGTPSLWAVPVEYSAGHADVGVAYEDGELHLHYHFGIDAVLDGTPLGSGLPAAAYEYESGEVIVRVPDSQRTSRPTGAQWDFLGTAAGADLWTIPQNSVTGAPFLGVAAEDLEPGEWSGPIRYTLTSMIGPGAFSVWQTDFFGSPTVRMASGDGISAFDDWFNVPIGSHSHYNWGFTAPGVYEVGLLASGTHNVDGFKSDGGLFTFLVGNPTSVVPEPASVTLLILGIFAAGLVYRWRRPAAATP